MGDKYEICGQVGAVGRHAKAEGNTFQQIYQEATSELDFGQLAGELATLREALKSEATTGQQYLALAAVVEATEAAEQGDGPTALERLKAAGQWAFEVATKIGTSVAAKALQQSMGLSG